MQTKPPFNKVVNSDAFKDFLNSAEEFCNFIESKQVLLPKEYLKGLQKSLLKLYQDAILLELIDIQFDVEHNTDIQINTINKNINRCLDNNRYYWVKFNPVKTDKEPLVCGDLLDDLSDIYKDIKEGLIIFKIGTPEAHEASIFGFKFNFDAHWGSHCMNALYGIHYFLQVEV